MWEPVGPLPAFVYWRRRWLAVASAVVAMVLFAWTVATAGAPATAADDGATTRASHAALTAPEQVSPSPGAPHPGTGTAGPAFVVPEADAAVSSGVTLPAVPATTSEELRPDETPRHSVPVPSPVPVPPTGPVPCTNAMLVVGAEIDRPEHRVGQRPVLRLVVTNITAQPCVRDLDSARQEIVVWSGDGATRLWSSNDCANASSVDLRTLVPGQPIAFAVTWAGRTSTPGCATARAALPAGAYRVLTRVDDIISLPAPFLRSA